MKTDIVEQQFIGVFAKLFATTSQTESLRGIILPAVSYRLLPPGSILLQAGDTCDQLPFVLSGSIRVYKMSDSGREITLYRIQAGQSCILSATCGTDKKQFPAIAVAEVPTSVAFLPVAVFGRLHNDSLLFRNFILEQYADRMVEVMELVEEIAFRHVDQRLHEWLLTQGGGSVIGQVEVTHRELADHLGTSREVISRILKDWEDRHLVKLSRAAIELSPGFAKLLF